jgi:MFS family permease
MILFIPQAITTNFSAILAIRWFQGMSSSVGNSMVGGTIADIFRAEDRGSGMNIFSVVIFAGQVSFAFRASILTPWGKAVADQQSFGGVFFGWIAMNLGIRWCYWVRIYCRIAAF